MALPPIPWSEHDGTVAGEKRHAWAQAVGDEFEQLPTTYSAAFADTVIGYDGSGNVDSVIEGGIETTYTYNADGTVDTDTRLGVTRQYTYDGEGNLTGIEAV